MKLKNLKLNPVGFYQVFFKDGSSRTGCIGRFDDGYNTEASLWISFPHIYNGSFKITKSFARTIDRLVRIYI